MCDTCVENWWQCGMAQAIAEYIQRVLLFPLLSLSLHTQGECLMQE